MPTFSLTVSQKAVDKLKLVVDRHNQTSGESLTVKQWILMTLKQAAIQAELAANLAQIQADKEAEAQQALVTAIEAERDALLAELDT